MVPNLFVLLLAATIAADSLDIGMAQQIAEQLGERALEMPQPPLQPNPPVWPHSVTVFGPDDAAEANAVMTQLSTTLNDRAAGHFSDERRAFLFKPGAYEMDVAVGYYVSEVGDLNQIVHMWRYESFEERAEKRTALFSDPAWLEYVGKVGPMILNQKNAIFNDIFDS